MLSWPVVFQVIFLVLFWAFPGVLSPQDLFPVLVIFPCYLLFSMLYYSLKVFYTGVGDCSFIWFWADSKSPQVSRTLPGILVDLNNDLVWVVSACVLISKFSSPFTKPLGIVPSVPITICIIVTSCFIALFILLWE